MAEEPEEVRVWVGKSEVELSCFVGETLIQCAWRNGYYWPTICGGTGDCGACRCMIKSNAGTCGELQLEEQVYFRTHPSVAEDGTPIRLACCLEIRGPLVVEKRGIRKK